MKFKFLIAVFSLVIGINANATAGDAAAGQTKMIEKGASTRYPPQSSDMEPGLSASQTAAATSSTMTVRYLRTLYIICPAYFAVSATSAMARA